jgi:hypothetical protein
MKSIGDLLDETVTGLGLTTVSEPTLWTRSNVLDLSNNAVAVEEGRCYAKVQVDLGLGHAWLMVCCRYKGEVMQEPDIMFFDYDPGDGWHIPIGGQPFAGVYSGSFRSLDRQVIIENFLRLLFG